MQRSRFIDFTCLVHSCSTLTPSLSIFRIRFRVAANKLCSFIQISCVLYARVVNLLQRVCDARVHRNTWPAVTAAAGEDCYRDGPQTVGEENGARAATSAINFYE